MDETAKPGLGSLNRDQTANSCLVARSNRKSSSAFPDPAPGLDWDAVRADYETGGMQVPEIAALHEITVNQLNYRRRKENWGMRHKGTGRTRRHGLLARMMGLIEAQIAQMEQGFRENKPMSATEMRLLESMTKALDKIIALEDTDKKTTPKRVRMDPELEAVREKLIERIAELDTE